MMLMRNRDLGRWPERITAALTGGLLAILISGNGRMSSHQLVGRLLSGLTEGEELEEEGEIFEEEEEEEEEGEGLDATVVMCIVLLLILLTIAFELFKETLEEKATRSMRVIIEKLFGELTVLGFLSMVTFIMSQAGFFPALSVAVFGDDEELLEVFESVHFTIFFIMVAFVVQVLVLVVEARRIQKEWEQYEKEAAQESAPRLQVANWSEKTILRGLKEEFLLNRGIEYPFKPAEESTRLQPQFSFSRYLAVSMASILSHTVEVHTSTWAFFAVLTVLYYLFRLVVQEDLTVLSWSWAGIGWIVFLWNLLFERHLTKLREGFTTAAVIKEAQGSDRNGQEADETSPLNEPLDGTDTLPSDLPLWCHVDLDRYLDNRSWFSSYFVGGKPNRQDALFWMERKGPHLYLATLQVNILFVGIYFALLILRYVKHMHSESPTGVFIAYLFVSLVPLVAIIIHKKRIISILTQVCSVGVHRNPKFIADVTREEKTTQIIRSFEVIYKLGKFASVAGSKEHDATTGRLLLERLDLTELREAQQTFDAFDSSGDGSINHQEFKDLMSNLGADVSDEVVSKMLGALDSDGSGKVSRDEFLAWYAENCAGEDGEEISLHDQAKFLFGIFDSNKSGSITIGELMQKLEALNISYTIDELGAIVNELDEDNSGNISLHEFTEMFERYGE